MYFLKETISFHSKKKFRFNPEENLASMLSYKEICRHMERNTFEKDVGVYAVQDLDGAYIGIRVCLGLYYYSLPTNIFGYTVTPKYIFV